MTKIAIKIWMITVILNTFFLTAWQTDFFSNKPEIAIPVLISLFFVFIGIVSLPFFLVLLISMKISISKNDSGKIIFRKTLVSGIVSSVTSTLIVYYIFKNDPLRSAAAYHFFYVLFSSAVAIFSQRKHLMCLSRSVEFDSI